MTENKRPKGAPIRLGQDLSEDEATVLDVSVEDLEARERAEAAKRSKGPPARPKRFAPPSVADDDLEKTELLERPDLDDVISEPPSAPARGVVPLGGSSARLVGRSGRDDLSPGKTASHDIDEDQETLLLTRPPSSKDEAANTPEVRALEDVSFAAIVDDAANDATLSRPKISRMTFRPSTPPALDDAVGGAFADTHKRAGPPADGSRPTPRPLPPPPSSGRSARPTLRPPAEKRQPDASGEADGPTGRILIEVPADAVVFVDGVERGRGAVEIAGVDRFARVALRVHLSGRRPWNKTVTLDGAAELRVSPDFEPR